MGGHNNLIANTQTAVKTVERSFSAEPTNGNQATRYSTGTDTRDIVVGVASKKPKDEAVIIEELQVANSHLRKMVDSLFYELSSCQRENLELKARVHYLETMHAGKCVAVQPQTASRPISQSAQPSPSHGCMKTFKPELATPVRVPPSSRLGPPPPQQFASREDLEDSSIQSSSTIAEDCDLPPLDLPPLELPPSFDFTQKTSTTHPTTSNGNNT